MKNALRIVDKNYFIDEDFEKHIAYVAKIANQIDEVAIFLEYCHHAYIPLDEVKNRLDIIKSRMAEYRKLGIKSVGINILNTFGQTDEAWDVMPKSNIPHMVGHNGFVSRSCLCPHSKEFEDYTTKKLTMVAELEPDFIWLDDDLRVKNHGPQYVCFCPNCVKLFNKKYGFEYERENLVKEMDMPDGTDLRSKWVHHSFEELNRVIKFCKNVVLSINPNIEFGLMTCSEEEDSVGIHNIAQMTANLGATKLRPGGGFYTDDYLKECLFKLICISREVGKLNCKIPDIQYEYENYPHLTYSKSLKMVDFESTASLMCGCNGILYNAGGDSDRIMNLVSQKRTKWNLVTDYTKDSRSHGVNIAYNNLYATRKTYKGDFFLNPDIWTKPPIYDIFANLTEAGLAMASVREDAKVHILFDDLSEGFTNEEILSMLSGAVYMDGLTAEKLIARGFGKYIGVSIKEKHHNGIKEIVNNNNLNVSAKGFIRDYALTFFSRDPEKCAAWVLEPLKNATVLADMYTIPGEYIGPSFTVFENELGGRVAVAGYIAYDFLRDKRIMERMHNIIDWLSGGNFPIKISHGLKLMPIIRKNHKATTVFLGNCNLDETGVFEFELRDATPLKTYEITDKGLNEYPSQTNGNNTTIKVENIEGWSYRIFVLEN